MFLCFDDDGDDDDEDEDDDSDGDADKHLTASPPHLGSYSARALVKVATGFLELCRAFFHLTKTIDLRYGKLYILTRDVRDFIGFGLHAAEFLVLVGRFIEFIRAGSINARRHGAILNERHRQRRRYNRSKQTAKKVWQNRHDPAIVPRSSDHLIMAFLRTHHENKFDRQMRLWGGHGQQQLESAHIAIIGSSATAAETLKNLILPNLKRYTVIDDAFVTEADVGNNYFIPENAVGRKRGAVLVERMTEMNSESQGTHIDASITDVLASHGVAFADAFDCIILTQQSESNVRALSKHCYDRNITFIHLRTYGLIGLARLQIREHCIIEAHPQSDVTDLYVHPQQWKHIPQLIQYAHHFTLTAPPDTVSSGQQRLPLQVGQDGEEHAHIPYAVILIQTMETWLSSHPVPPNTYEEKKAFKQMIRDSAYSVDETNFDEAVEYASRSYELPKLSDESHAVLNDKNATVEYIASLTQNGGAQKVLPHIITFWICVVALKRFIVEEGGGVCLPVSTDIPDMHSRTEWYVTLKAIYKAASDRDYDAVRSHVQAVLAECHLPTSSITDDYLTLFVKNCRTLRVVRTRSIDSEYGSPASEAGAETAERINGRFETDAEDEADNIDPDAPPPPVHIPNPPLLHWYIALRCVDEFYAARGHWPAQWRDEEVSELEAMDEQSEPKSTWHTDAEALRAYGTAFFSAYRLTAAECDSDTLTEMARFGACEPHNIASVMGGIGAQIALKMLLKQYVPINHTFLFNGIHCSSTVFNL